MCCGSDTCSVALPWYASTYGNAQEDSSTLILVLNMRQEIASNNGIVTDFMGALEVLWLKTHLMILISSYRNKEDCHQPSAESGDVQLRDRLCLNIYVSRR